VFRSITPSTHVAMTLEPMNRSSKLLQRRSIFFGQFCHPWFSLAAIHQNAMKIILAWQKFGKNCPPSL